MTQKEFFRDHTTVPKDGSINVSIALAVSVCLKQWLKKHPEKEEYSQTYQKILPTFHQVAITQGLINALFSLYEIYQSSQQGVDWSSDFQKFRSDPDRWKKIFTAEAKQLSDYFLLNPIYKKVARKILPSEQSCPKIFKALQYTKEAIDRNQFSLTTTQDYLDQFILGTIFAPFTEEFLFRGVLAQQTAKRFPDATPEQINRLQAFTFGSEHGAKVFPFATIIGYLLSDLDQSNEDNLWYSIVSHGAHNAVYACFSLLKHELQVHGKLPKKKSKV